MNFIKKIFQEKGQVCSICLIQYQRQQDEGERAQFVCYNCWYAHIRTVIERITYKVGENIMSPFHQGADIDVIKALNSLKTEHKILLQEFLFKKYTAFTPDIQKCPSQQCDFVFIGENCRFGPKWNYNCPKCSVSLRTSNSLSISSLLGKIYFLIFAGQCPKCSIPIQRISGCPHMTCPCGHQFCWHCSKDHRESNNNLYNVHTNKQCGSIFVSKILLLILCQFCILQTMAGHQGFRYMTNLIFDCLWILFKTLLVDSFILGHILLYMYVARSLPRWINKFQYILVLIFNCTIATFLLIYFEQLWTVITIILFQILTAGSIAGSIFLIYLSDKTWFGFIS